MLVWCNSDKLRRPQSTLVAHYLSDLAASKGISSCENVGGYSHGNVSLWDRWTKL